MNWLNRVLGRGSSPTRYSDDDFELVLDGVWQPDHEDTHVEFGRPSDNEQVTVVAMRPRTPVDASTLLSVAQDLVEVRQQAFREISGTAITFGEAVTEPTDGGFDVGFTAVDLEHAVQSRVVVCARLERIVTLSYNKYDPLLPESEFQARCAAIRSGLRIR